MMIEDIVDKSFIDNEHLFIGKGKILDEDKNPMTVQAPKIWRSYGSLYKCGNCGYIPTYVNITDIKRCPKCEVLKTFYESDGDLYPMFSDNQ